MRFVSVGVNSGAYRGAGVEDRTLLRHAVATDAAFTVGRLTRGPREALCSRKLDVSDDDDDIRITTCPRCRDVLERLGVDIHGIR